MIPENQNKSNKTRITIGLNSVSANELEAEWYEQAKQYLKTYELLYEALPEVILNSEAQSRVLIAYSLGESFSKHFHSFFDDAATRYHHMLLLLEDEPFKSLSISIEKRLKKEFL
ncbi:MAG: hypothetical protein H7A25_05280 [Leptospiraceae bacterium]|nr:hypothetical protein [Leptospiraceae bacterium]